NILHRMRCGFGEQICLDQARKSGHSFCREESSGAVAAELGILSHLTANAADFDKCLVEIGHKKNHFVMQSLCFALQSVKRGPENLRSSPASYSKPLCTEGLQPRCLFFPVLRRRIGLK